MPPHCQPILCRASPASTLRSHCRAMPATKYSPAMTVIAYACKTAHLAGFPHRPAVSIANIFYRLVPRSVPGRSLSYSLSLPWPERYLEDISLRPVQRQIEFLSNDFILPASGESDPYGLFRSYIENAPARDPLSRLYLDSKTYYSSGYSHQGRPHEHVDLSRGSLAHGRSYFPGVGDRINFGMEDARQRAKIYSAKTGGKTGHATGGFVSPKRGFALPLVHWTRHELKGLIQTVLLEPRILQRGYLNPAGIRQLLDEHFRGRRNHAGRIWRLLMLELWHRNYLETIHSPAMLSPEPAAHVSGGTA